MYNNNAYTFFFLIDSINFVIDYESVRIVFVGTTGNEINVAISLM